MKKNKDVDNVEEIESRLYQKDLDEIVKIYRRLKTLSCDIETVGKLITSIGLFGVLSFVFSVLVYFFFISGVFSALQALVAIIILFCGALTLTVAIVYHVFR